MSRVQGRRDGVESGVHSRTGFGYGAARGFIEDLPEEEAVTGFQSRITRGAAQKLGETT